MYVIVRVLRVQFYWSFEKCVRNALAHAVNWLTRSHQVDDDNDYHIEMAHSRKKNRKKAWV